MDEEGYMDDVRRQARRAILKGDEMLNGITARGQAPAKQWWNVPAKYHAAKTIKDEMLSRFPGWNNAGDAQRHAELSRRMAVEIDPITAAAAGYAHELDNSIPSQASRLIPPWLPQLHEHARQNWRGQGAPEMKMDLRNNAEGRRAARSGRPVNPANLQTAPQAPPNRASLPR